MRKVTAQGLADIIRLARHLCRAETAALLVATPGDDGFARWRHEQAETDTEDADWPPFPNGRTPASIQSTEPAPAYWSALAAAVAAESGQVGRVVCLDHVATNARFPDEARRLAAQAGACFFAAFPLFRGEPAPAAGRRTLLGVLCVFDSAPRQLRAPDQEAFTLLARQSQRFVDAHETAPDDEGSGSAADRPERTAS